MLFAVLFGTIESVAWCLDWSKCCPDVAI